MPADPLSEILSLLKPRSYMFGGFECGGDWSMQFSGRTDIKCYAIASGQCWMTVEGVGEAVHLKAGDCFLLPLGRPFRMASDLALPPVDYRQFFTSPSNGAVRKIDGGGDFLSVGGRFALAGSHAAILLDGLPPIVHLHSEADRAALRWSIERLRQELSDPRPGGFLVAEHLIHMMLVQAFRLHLAEQEPGRVGWLFALADKQLSVAITAMHEAPAERWTVQELASRAGMSRSGFAARFKETVGVSPMDYLARWRMLLAGDRLENSREPVSAIALSLGYESESAFSTAFKRVMGCSPRRYGRAA
jgi:AraC-like DNA-binding protein